MKKDPGEGRDTLVFRIGWFSTGRDRAARDLLSRVSSAISTGYIPSRIEYVFCNRADKEDKESEAFFHLARDLMIPILCIPSKGFLPELREKGLKDPEEMLRWRLAYDREIEKKIGSIEVDVVVLAGYMLIVGPELCRRLPMINLHPALPGGPKGTWQEVIWKLILDNATETGAMMHVVTEELDKGPPISYFRFSLKDDRFDLLWEDTRRKIKKWGIERLIEEEGEENPLFRKIREEGVIREVPLIIETLRIMAEGKIRIGKDGPCDEHGMPIEPLCLNEYIDKILK